MSSSIVPGDLTLEHRTPGRTYPLAQIEVSEERVEPSLGAEFERLRTNADMAAERERIESYLEAEPDKTTRVHRRDGYGYS